MDPKTKRQLIWGFALIVMGIGVFFRVPVVSERLAGAAGTSAKLYFFRFSFYLIAVILIGGGIKKIRQYWPAKQ
jgi:hypothetical protein